MRRACGVESWEGYFPELPQRGPGRSLGRQRIFGIFKVHRKLLVERTRVTLLNDVQSPESDVFK